MNLLKEYAKRFTPGFFLSGEVISVKGKRVRVGTRYGVLEFPGKGLKPEDQVVIIDGVAVKKKPRHDIGFRV
ncbi:MAG: hypothetical protein HQL52_11120 [Magnetococcales bacterium]|nr:hypothetical protein [Magnetococcales bacterium]